MQWDAKSNMGRFVLWENLLTWFLTNLLFLTVCGTAQTRISPYKYRGRIQRKTRCMWPYAGVDYNLTLCPLQSRRQHIYHEQPYARVDLNPMPTSTLFPNLGLWIWPLDSPSLLHKYIIQHGSRTRRPNNTHRPRGVNTPGQQHSSSCFFVVVVFVIRGTRFSPLYRN
jgi:hypothetical protein